MRHLLAALTIPFAISSFAFDIVKDGKATAEIIAHEELARHVEFFCTAVHKCTGVTLPQVDNPTDKLNKITFKLEQRSPFTEDAYDITFPDAKTMLITGSRYSVRWALNRLLEDQGVCFCQAGEHGTHYPSLKSFTLSSEPLHGDYDVKLFRDLYQDGREYALCVGGKHAVDIDPEIFFHHNLYKLLPPSKYSKPPYLDTVMPMLNGKRIAPVLANAQWQPCLSSKVSVEEAVKNIRAYLDEHPTFRLVSLGINDSGGFCECPECIKMNGGARKGEFYTGPCFSDAFYKWCGMVIDEVLKTHPDTYFGCIAYAQVFDPPTFKIHPRLTPVFCIETYQFSFPKGYEKYEKLFKAWEPFADNLGIYDYGYGCLSYCFPRIYTKMQDKIMKSFIKRGCRSYFAEGDGHYGEGPKRYLSYKLCQNGNLDTEAELNRWYEACVGKEAAPYLKKYYDTLEEFWTSEEIQKTVWFQSLCVIYMSFYEHSHIYGMTMDVMDKCRDAMETMISLAEKHGDADQKIRARDQMSYFRYYEALAHASACGIFPADRIIKSPEQAKAFIQAIPDMSKYLPMLQKYGQEIHDLRKRENFETALNSIEVFTEPHNRVPFSLQMGFVMPYLHKYPELMAELKKVNESPLEKFFKDRIEYLIAPEKAEEFIVQDLSPEEELKLWRGSNNISIETTETGRKRYAITATKPTLDIRRLFASRPGRQYLLSYRITFKTPSPKHTCLAQHVSVSRTTFGLSQYRRQEPTRIKGETYDGLDINISSSSGYAGCAFFSFDGLTPGETIYIDNLSVIEAEVPLPMTEIAECKNFADYPQNWSKLPETADENGVLKIPSFKTLACKKAIDIPEGCKFIRFSLKAAGQGRFQYRITLQDEKGGKVDAVNGDQITLNDTPTTYEYEVKLSSKKRRNARKAYVIIASHSEQTIEVSSFSAKIAK